jgi:predicted dehydrogenase
MAPIRVGIIGLASGTEVTASPGGGWASSAHLPYLLASPHYEIVALCNSSVESAKIAVKKYDLPTSTKAYGRSEDLANDLDVDLVVCSVRVDRHYKLMKPVLEMGKNAFVEWPLGANLQEAEELTTIAQKSGSTTMVGLQGRIDPGVQKLRELNKGGKIGDVLSTVITAHVGGLGGAFEPPGIEYQAQKAVGGNLLTIVSMHTIDN